MTISEAEALRQIRNILDQVAEPEPDVDPDAPEPDLKAFRFSGEFAPWNIPAAKIGTHPQNRLHRSEFLNCCDGKININSRLWSPHIRWFDDSTPRVARLEMKRPSWGNLPANEPLPWDVSWTVPHDDDAYSVLIEKGTGRCYVVWQTDYDARTNVMRCGTAYEHQKTTWMRRTSPGDVRVKENGSTSDRACGIYYPALLATRAEIEAGEIRHAMGVAIPRPTRGAMMPPATKGTGVMGGPRNRSAMGLRFVWDLTDDDIEGWLDGFQGDLKRHLRTIAVCIRDYGLIVADHGGNEARRIGSTQIEADNSARWDEIGLPAQPTQNALHSLLQPMSHKMRCLAEPIFPGGDMNRVAVYNGVQYPDGYR